MAVREADVVLVGGGVMSATLGVLLKQLDPSLDIVMVERLDQVAKESSAGWNNAGTGHAGYCELNYTPETESGDISIERALDINARFEVSLQLWAYLVEQGVVPNPDSFINRTPHQNFVWGEGDVAFLKRRHEKLSAHHLFREMEYSELPDTLREWMPLVVTHRDPMQRLAATQVAHGADVDCGSLTRRMVSWLDTQPTFGLMLGAAVVDLQQEGNRRWQLQLRDRNSGAQIVLNAGFVFLGAGGAALPLSQKSGIAAARGYGALPVSGQFLLCRKPEIAAQHHSKVYGQAPVGAPPMSVPHLDRRMFNNETALLFGPFAGFTTRLLKHGSIWDLFRSLRVHNLWPMLSAGVANRDLIRYLITEVFKSSRKRFEALRDFYPDAREEDWKLQLAGQRVQVVKKAGDGRGELEFGTEIVTSDDATLAALLGASPGASTSAEAMLRIIERCFPGRLKEPQWQEQIRAMIPSYGQSLIENETLLHAIRERTHAVLELGYRVKTSESRTAFSQ